MTDALPRGAGLHVVTINTWKGDGDYHARIDALIEQLRDLDPDVVTLQEALVAVDVSLSTPAALAGALDMRVVTHATRLKTRVVGGRTVRSWSALATLSRWPVLETTGRPLPAAEADADRSALFVAIETPSGTVRIANTHLTHLRQGSDVRRAQLRALLGDPFLARPASVRLLCGDLNATPSSPEIAWLHCRPHTWHVLDASDCCTDAAGRATLSARNPHVSPGAGERVIDYILSLAPDAGAHPPSIDARVVLNKPSTAGVFPSDHFGLSVLFGA